MKIIIIGCGGRENILTEKLNNGNNKLYCIGNWINPDIHEKVVEYYTISLNDTNALLEYCDNVKPDLIVIGPETVLSTNFVDECINKGYKCIGPSKKLAQLETSKIFTRELIDEIGERSYNPYYFELHNNSINKLIFETFKIFEIDFVIKLDGLAGGKGVFVQGDHFKTREEGIKLIKSKLEENKIIIEKKLTGEEFSLFTLCDGEHFFHLPPVQDYKRAYENNQGPNTGGMGSIMDKFDFLNTYDIINCENLNEKVLKHMKNKYNKPYIGILYGSYMKTTNGDLKLIEYNCRFGDSEVFNILNCIKTDLSLIFKHMVNGNLHELNITIDKKTNIVKYLVPDGYPIEPKLKKISYEKINNVYAASLNESNNLLGSRTIAVYGEGNNLKEAYDNCEELINKINKDNLFWRKDIGKKDDAYKLSGVDIDKGNEFVKLIKEDVESTYNENVLGKHGNFGGQYRYNNNVLVASTDGVGTKSILIKKYTGNYYTCGHDIVNHSINDILVQGATPLFFLDYVASSKLNIEDISSFVKGCCDACKKTNCVLLGGETAEMPSIYRDNHIDMVGTIVGEKTISIETLKEGDLAIGFPSSGPQTNGYTLIRKILEDNEPPEHILKSLLNPHGSFLDRVLELNKNYIITGMCHITGGGLTENLKRIVPNNLEINLNSIEYPDWCVWLQKNGKLSSEEMKKIFNCGIGYIVFVRPIIKSIKQNNKIRIGILGSTNGTDLDYIIRSINKPSSNIYNNVEIALTISDKCDSGILKKCINYNIKNMHIPYIKGEGREIYDEKITKEFEKENVDFILCIGWMRILSNTFIKKWKQRCLNVHPSLLPKYGGGMDIKVHEEVLKNKETETGCTIHFITEEVDAGPIVMQKKCIIEEFDTAETLKLKVQKLEGDAYIETLELLHSNIIGKNNNNIYLGMIKNKY